MNTNPNCKDTCNIDIHNIDITILKRTFAFAAIIVLSFVSAYGQVSINLTSSNNNLSTAIVCGTKYYFYDSGGPGNNYSNNEDYKYTFTSSSPIYMHINYIETETKYDQLKIYNSADIIDANLIATIDGDQTNLEFLITTGILVIKWKSDAGSNYRGWDAEIGCAEPHTLTYNTNANCIGGSASGAPIGTTGLSATITNTIPTCSTFPAFLGWNTFQDGSGTNYIGGDNISLSSSDITLYAQYTDCSKYTIINGDDGTTYNLPFCSYITYGSYPRTSYSQMLYTKDEINASGFTGQSLIRKIYFDYHGTDNQEMTFDIYMCNTNFTSFGYNWATGLQTVATNKTITFTPGWVEIELDDEFIWDGTSNLVIALHAKTQASSGWNRRFNYKSRSASVKYQYSSGQYFDLSPEHIPAETWTAVTETNTLPNLKLCMAPYCDPPAFLFTTAAAERALGSSYNLTDIFTLNNPTGRPVTYTCNPAEATISGTTITPLVGGEITITAHIDAHNGNCEADATATLTVTCTEPSFEFSQYGVFCTISNSVSAPSYTTNSTSTSVTYSSSNEAVATVNPSTGVVTGVSEGYTTITAYLASSGNFCQKTASFVAYISPDENCMPFTVGTCNTRTVEHCETPFYTMNADYTHSYVQMLYTADELHNAGLSAGKINKIAFHYYGKPEPLAGGDTHDFSQSFKVFIGSTTETSLSSNWITPTTGFVEKFSGSKSFYYDSWTYIELTDGFNWDGTSNIVVAINTFGDVLPSDRRFCMQNSDPLARYYGTQSGEISLNSNKIPSSGAGTSTIFRADIKFCKDASTIILPIELSKFEAKCHNDKVYIIWTTSSEKDNEAFIIERSSNAVDFIEIARIGGYGNSIEAINYQYTDESPDSGDNYYRLVQIDTDGTRTQSEIIVAKCHDNKLDDMQVEAYPNPFNDKLTISLYNFDGQNTTIEIFDMLGKIVKSISVLNPSNYHEITISIDGLPQAAYNLRVSASGHVTNKIVVKN